MKKFVFDSGRTELWFVVKFLLYRMDPFCI